MEDRRPENWWFSITELFYTNVGLQLSRAESCGANLGTPDTKKQRIGIAQKAAPVALRLANIGSALCLHWRPWEKTMASFEDADYLDLRAVTQLLGCHVLTAGRWCRQGRFRDTRRAHDGRWLISRAEVLGILEAGYRRPPMLEEVRHA